MGLALLDRVEAASTLLNARPASMSRWIDRLKKGLDAVGALDAFGGDVAGQAVLDLLEKRGQELAGTTAEFGFPTWRDWLNREFEGASFRDSSIVV